ncbi:homeobox protein notochord [Echinops telfairi]|uniref:Homeobox protein notochord n=1 Tax=Echinops telfairi TaxID=9371 RepID=A0ABM0ZQK0_ECHTE|nr:homeobox protein notochord [Echinops telfairi]
MGVRVTCLRPQLCPATPTGATKLGGSPTGSPRGPQRTAPGWSEYTLGAVVSVARPGWTASSGWAARYWPVCSAVPWPCPATWLPAPLGVGLYPLCPQASLRGLRGAHFCVLPGLGATGVELAHCPALWDPPAWSTAQDLHDTDPPKRVRTMFNLEQLMELEKVFATQHNLVGKKRAQLAARLNLTENQVRVWFQNRRVKYQKQQRLNLSAPDEPLEGLPSSRSEGATSGEDPGELGRDSVECA